MSAKDHTQSWQLEILANNKILVPGCEPSSALSSRALAAAMARDGGCGNALVNVADALAAIPGSFIKFGANFNRLGYRQKWFVLPPISPFCPCRAYADFYAILKSLATTELPIEDNFSACDINGMGYCPSPDFQLVEPPPPNPYQAEGTFPTVGGVLPPLPPWS